MTGQHQHPDDYRAAIAKECQAWAALKSLGLSDPAYFEVQERWVAAADTVLSLNRPKPKLRQHHRAFSDAEIRQVLDIPILGAVPNR